MTRTTELPPPPAPPSSDPDALLRRALAQIRALATQSGDAPAAAALLIIERALRGRTESPLVRIGRELDRLEVELAALKDERRPPPATSPHPPGRG